VPPSADGSPAWSPNDSYYWAETTVSRDNAFCDFKAFGARLLWDL